MYSESGATYEPPRLFDSIKNILNTKIATVLWAQVVMVTNCYHSSSFGCHVTR